MVDRHEYNIHREEKAGVMREYEPLYANQNWVEPTLDVAEEEDYQMENPVFSMTGKIHSSKPKTAGGPAVLNNFVEVIDNSTAS